MATLIILGVERPEITKIKILVNHVLSGHKLICDCICIKELFHCKQLLSHTNLPPPLRCTKWGISEEDHSRFLIITWSYGNSFRISKQLVRFFATQIATGLWVFLSFHCPHWSGEIESVELFYVMGSKLTSKWVTLEWHDVIWFIVILSKACITIFLVW